MTSFETISGLEIPIYDGCVYFDDWLKANGYFTQSSFWENARTNGYSDEVIEAELESLENEFQEWAETNGFQPEVC